MEAEKHDGHAAHGPPTVEPPGLPADRDGASARGKGARADESAAAEIRTRLACQPLSELAPDVGIAQLLGPGEKLLALRRGVALERRQPQRGRRAGIAGDLYLTSARLLFRGRLIVSYNLADLAEVDLTGERLLLVMRDGTGVSLDVSRPRVLRVEIGAARMALRHKEVRSKA